MSFSWEVKKKLCENCVECKICPRAELAGVIGFLGDFSDDRLRIATEHEEVAEKISNIITENIGIVSDVLEGKIFKIIIEEEKDLNKIREYVGLLDSARDNIFFNEITMLDCCKRSYIRGAFLAGGYVSSPQKRYHIEFDTKYKKSANRLQRITSDLGIRLGMTERKDHFLLYLKDGDGISDLLGIMGADFGALSVMYAQMEKNVRNDINRQINCEAANADKLAKAARVQLNAIDKITRKMTLDSLPESLHEMAVLRKRFPEDSLKRLGEKCVPPIGKSGANHRLDKLIKLAEKL